MFASALLTLGLITVCTSGKFDGSIDQTKPSVLIIGSSIPALTSALILTDKNYSVTIMYATDDIDNQLSPSNSFVQEQMYRLPKHHPAIFEHSTLTRQLAKQLGNTFLTQDEINLWYNDKELLSISKDEWIPALLWSARKHNCVSFKDIMEGHKFVNSLKNYNYEVYRKLYSNITMAQFAHLMGAPSSYLTCFINPALIESGLGLNTINAADAIARMQFYYFQNKNGLRSYHMNNPYSTTNGSKLLIDQIVHRLKLKNTTFIPNYWIDALWVDPDQGTILGDLKNRAQIFDYVIIGDNLNRSKAILAKTLSYNTGAPKIFNPLTKALNSLNQYSAPPRLFSIKIWLTNAVNSDRKPIIEVANNPYPFSLQSIKQLDKLASPSNPGHILELIVADNTTAKLDYKKILNDLYRILPEIKSNPLLNSKADFIDTGVAMDVNYGANRMFTTSLMDYGIRNLILAGDWLDLGNEPIACDLEKSVAIGSQAAKKIISNFYFRKFINFL